MTYTPVPTVYTNDLWTAANHNLYIKDNLAHVEAQGEGEETFWMSAAALWAETGNEPGGLTKVDAGTMVYLGIPFDETTDEYLNFLMGMPKRYDKASCHVQYWWSSEAATTGSVVWATAINALDDGDALGSDPSAGVANVTDAWQANNDLHKSAWTEVTPNNSPSDDNVGFEMRFGRDADHGSDNMDDDAILIGILYRWTTNVEMDD